MSTRGDYPAGVPCWIDTVQPDPAEAARFYSALFGWDTEDTMPAGADGNYYMARIGGRDAAAISSPAPGAPAQAVWNTYVRVESADDAADRVREAGGQVLTAPFDVFDAGRMGVFADPEGAVCSVWEPGRHRGAAAVNEHGAVVFNNLHTDDPQAAQAFYGAVFGWGTIEVDSPMWALPGYGDYLEDLNPGMRARMRQMGAPEGFEDVVAGILPRNGGPARWSVTFAVDDVDAVATSARELGGSVLVEPRDAPWTRSAVLADPAGASFIASQFVPENR
ncbi:MAG: VOC family protein [Microbacteriaceae bacterium]|nr:MAG: VOC family protein [Microbacteriaceae bacterium]